MSGMMLAFIAAMSIDFTCAQDFLLFVRKAHRVLLPATGVVGFGTHLLGCMYAGLTHRIFAPMATI